MKVRIDRRGPAGHGVTLHAQAVTRLVKDCGVGVVGGGWADLTHAQFTDALWGPDIGTAAATYVAWTANVPRPLVVTLHDVPGGDPDAARDARRCEGYKAVATASDEVIVSSAHEADKVRRLGSGRAVTVVELPLPPLGAPIKPDLAWTHGPSLAVIGFLYPGKGHIDVIDAAARQTPAPQVIALGEPSPGHGHLRGDLQRHADAQGVDFTVAGHLSDGVLASAIAAVTVPVVPGRLTSASSSLLTWIAQRRRPLCADGAYSREIDSRYPGAVQRYADPSALDDLIATCLADPSTPWLRASPDWPDVGARHVQCYVDLLRNHGATCGP